MHFLQGCGWHQAEWGGGHLRDRLPFRPEQALAEGLCDITKFNKCRCKVLHLNQADHQYKYRLGDEGTESSPAEDLGSLVGKKLTMSWQHALTAQRPTISWDGVKERMQTKMILYLKGSLKEYMNYNLLKSLDYSPHDIKCSYNHSCKIGEIQ